MDTSENPENGGENKENEEDPSKKSPPEPREAVITGGVDDIVRVWNVNDGKLTFFLEIFQFFLNFSVFILFLQVNYD